MKEIAYEKGGECLSGSYVNNHIKLTWKCEKGHIWDAVPAIITNGSWCPMCSGRVITIYDMYSLAKTKNGKCLSHEYINSTTKLLWECHNGHQWKAIPNSIQQGSWCPICNSKTISDMKQLAESHGGKCLSESYSGSDTRLLWECSHGHIWEAIPNDVQRGRWCPNCKEQKKNQKKRKSLEELYGIAILGEGKCLSSTYYDVDTKLKWECKYGHQLESTPYSITRMEAGVLFCAYKKVGSHKKGTIEDMQSLAKRIKVYAYLTHMLIAKPNYSGSVRRVINGTLILIVFSKAHGVQLVEKMRFLEETEKIHH